MKLWAVNHLQYSMDVYPNNVLDLKLGIKPKWKTTPNSDLAEQLQKQIDEVRATAKDNIMLSYLKTTTAKRRQLRSK